MTNRVVFYPAGLRSHRGPYSVALLDRLLEYIGGWEATTACMSILLHDVWRALRALVAAPTFTVTAILSLAIGIGANTAIFSIVDGLHNTSTLGKRCGRPVSRTGSVASAGPRLKSVEKWNPRHAFHFPTSLEEIRPREIRATLLDLAG